MREFGLTEMQAQAILDMQLQRLTGPRAPKILDELAELQRTIERLRAILASDALLMEIVVDELQQGARAASPTRAVPRSSRGGRRVRHRGPDPREDMVISVSATGYIKRTRLDEYRLPAPRRRRGIGHAGARGRRRQPAVRRVHPLLRPHLYGSRPGLLAEGASHPGSGPKRQGQTHQQPRALEAEERVAALVTVRDWPEAEGEAYIVMGTRQGVIKKTDLDGVQQSAAGRHHRARRRTTTMRSSTCS